VVNEIGHRREGRSFKQAPQRHIHFEGVADPADEPGCQQRMTAQLKEVVIAPDSFQA
jgi:hypothetical protein